ncbi:MAG: glycosyltransferase family 9 protein [bacterium]
MKKDSNPFPMKNDVAQPTLKLLIVKPTALGDVAQACLIVPAIKKLRPDWHVSWVVDSDYAAVLKLCPGVDEIIEFPRRRWREQPCLLEIGRWLLRLRRARFDVVLDLQGLARSAGIAFASGARRRIGLQSSRELARFAYTEIVQDDEKHAVDRYQQAVEHLIGHSLPSTEQLRQPPLPDGLTPHSYTVLHPYSSWETKLWPWERFNRLAHFLPREKFVMVGNGPFFPVLADNVLDYRNQTSLEQLMSLLGHARMVISTDSGPAHLAAAFGRPVICLFGATDPDLTAPRAPQTIILTSPIPHRPCRQKICRRSDPMQCLTKISVEAVRTACIALLEK